MKKINNPFPINVVSGKTYFWCACGKSKNQPFCDGSHKNSKFNPVKFECSDTTKVFFCGCKKTSNPPFCDGSHKKLIFNLLDIPWHMPNIEKQTQLLIKYFLSKADIVTVISFKVKKDLEKFTSIKTHVIYNPRRDVYHDNNIKKDDSFLFVGRANDPVKRINLVYESLLKIDNGLKNLKVCGEQNPGFGTYLGYVSNNELNKLYNASKYVLLTSKNEGIGLPMIEAMICGSIPILCSDNETAKEFSPENFICDPNPQSIVKKINNLNKNYSEERKKAIDLGKKYEKMFDKINIVKNILNLKK